MTVSIFNAQRTATANFYQATTSFPDTWQIGQIIIGMSKVALRTAIHTFDLSAVPASGPPLPANAIVSLAELLANVIAALGNPWTLVAARLDDDRSAYVSSEADWNEWETGSPWRGTGVNGGGDAAAVPAPVTFPAPDFLGDGLITEDLAPLVTDALQYRRKLLQILYRITSGSNETQSYTLKASPPEDTDSTRLRVTWADPLASPIDHPHGVTLPGDPPAPAARPARAGGATTPAPPARSQIRRGGPPRTRRPHDV